MSRKIKGIVLAVIMVLIGIVPGKVYAASSPTLSLNKMVLYLDTNYVDKGYLNIANGTGKAKWASSNKKVATVSQHGTVVAKKVGTTKVTCKMGNKTLTCNVIVKKMPKEKITKGISVTYKDVKNYVIVTFKNKLSYPIYIHGGIVQYDKNGKKVDNFDVTAPCYNVKDIYVPAKTSVKYYIILDQNTSYYEKEKSYGFMDTWHLSMNENEKLVSPTKVTISKVNADDQKLYWKENNKLQFNQRYGFQILFFNKSGDLDKIFQYSNGDTVTNDDILKTEDGYTFTYANRYKELLDSGDTWKANVYYCKVITQNND